MAALLSGQGVNEVARQYNIDKSLVSRWRAKIPQQTLQQLATKRTDEFSELLTHCLRESLKTIAFQLCFMRTTDWLKSQEASALAVLLGVITDKAIRLLEAAQAANEPDALDVEATTRPAD